MSTSRRHFIAATGAVLSAPLTHAGAAVMHAQGDDASAIRALLHERATQIGATPAGFGSVERIDIGSDGRTATATLPCLVETETPIGPDCPLVDMARQQDGGVTRQTRQGTLSATCVTRDGTWTLAHAAFEPE